MVVQFEDTYSNLTEPVLNDVVIGRVRSCKHLPLCGPCHGYTAEVRDRLLGGKCHMCQESMFAMLQQSLLLSTRSLVISARLGCLSSEVSLISSGLWA